MKGLKIWEKTVLPLPVKIFGNKQTYLYTNNWYIKCCERSDNATDKALCYKSIVQGSNTSL